MRKPELRPLGGIFGAAVVAASLSSGCELLTPTPSQASIGQTDQSGIDLGDDAEDDSNASSQDSSGASAGSNDAPDSEDAPSEVPTPPEPDPLTTRFAESFLPEYKIFNKFACETEDEFCLVNYDRANVPLVAFCAQRTFDTLSVVEDEAREPYLDLILEAMESSQDCVERANEQCDSGEDEALCQDAMKECTDTFRSHISDAGFEDPDGWLVQHGILLCIYRTTPNPGG